MNGLVYVWYRWFLLYDATVALRDGRVIIDGKFHHIRGMKPLIYKEPELRPYVVEQR